MVEDLRARELPLTPPIEQAFLTVPRHLFVPGVDLNVVYSDRVIVTKRDKEGLAISSSSQPAIMAVMLHALALEPGLRVLEIGAGTGYNAALLAAIVGEAGQVTTIEIDDEIAEGAEAHLDRAGFSDVVVVAGDGSQGHPPGAPYDRIMSTASLWDLPPALIDQLAVGGILVAPLRFEGLQVGAALRKQATGALLSTQTFALGFIPLRGEASPPQRRTQIDSSALCVVLGDRPALDAASIHTLLSSDHDHTQLPLELDRRNLGMLPYFLVFNALDEYALVAYEVEEGQSAYGLTGIGWGILSPTSGCFVPYGDERSVEVYGSSDAYLTLARLAEAWRSAGQPGPVRGPLDGHVHIAPAGSAPHPVPGTATAARVYRRPTFTFTLWL